MKKFFAEDRIDYTGKELRSRWAERTFGVEGDSIAAFAGACDVASEHMKDLEDLAAGAEIKSSLMLHFIIELFRDDLEKGVLKQRLFADAVKAELEARGVKAVRDGDDLYEGDAKLSVSIATKSPVSALIHFGINIESHATPVKARGLADYKIPPREFAEAVMERFVKELGGVGNALTRVRGTD